MLKLQVQKSVKREMLLKYDTEYVEFCDKGYVEIYKWGYVEYV